MEANTLPPKSAPPSGIESIGNDYATRFGFRDPEEYFHKGKKGVDHEVVEMISRMKKEPEWMREFRHQALDIFLQKPMPGWGYPRRRGSSWPGCLRSTSRKWSTTPCTRT